MKSFVTYPIVMYASLDTPCNLQFYLSPTIILFANYKHDCLSTSVFFRLFCHKLRYLVSVSISVCSPTPTLTLPL